MYMYILLYSFLCSPIQINEKAVADNIHPTYFSETSELEIERTFQVKHQVRGNDVYLECLIPNFTFKQSGGQKRDGEGHLNVIIDGKRVEKISTAAFIIKGLTRGEHTLAIQVVHNDLTTYPLEHTIHVQIH
ncbi:hypothetical protein RGU12_03530 [Fredinandcohnia sp. QZ13]|uniref:hypothetical protein n=1 Tax=Fredinandcohnia sp. QZ13 TaxID=3073144 RepID=UPI002853245B|nr:hypothetical protein [Fredinandcohnia sp. QZ13]MDR4886620.1 hypothetical protein [Fredinandcohnia sp. QZ13]